MAGLLVSQLTDQCGFQMLCLRHNDFIFSAIVFRFESTASVMLALLPACRTNRAASVFPTVPNQDTPSFPPKCLPGSLGVNQGSLIPIPETLVLLWSVQTLSHSACLYRTLSPQPTAVFDSVLQHAF